MSGLDPIVNIHDIKKSYKLASQELQVLKGVSLTISRGEFVAIMGPSGSGKTTLLNVIGCIDTFDNGSYRFANQETHQISSDALAKLRAGSIGIVFQSFNLIPRMSSIRNVELPMIYRGVGKAARKIKARKYLEQVGLAERMEHLPAELSGGQQQRVAIARALANEPELLIADEPTGSLDTQTGDEIMSLFCKLNEAGKTIVMVTHEENIAAFASRIVRMRDGVLASEGLTNS